MIAATSEVGDELLSPDHLAMLRASAISDTVIAQRGAYTATKGAELVRLGYRRDIAAPPVLVLPLWGIDGEPVGYQIRPDRPPILEGRLAKYLSPPGSPVVLDIPPACRELIGAPRAALWVTEGVRKADSLASAGLTAVGLAGVQMFRCDDWDRIPLDGRRVYVVFDSDVMQKRAVHSALRALRDYLGARGAEVSFVYLPTDAGKVGVDDFLAGGASVSDLYELAEDELRPAPPEPEPERAPAQPTANLLDVIERLFCRFVRFPSEHEAAVLALFTLHTWTLAAARATPYLLLISPEKRSGKTRTLEVLELVVRQPLRASNVSAAGLFQSVEKWTPTLLIDEIDAVFAAKSESAEALRGAIGGGNRPGSFVIRGTQDGEPQTFETYCPKVLSGINTGRMPDTIKDRSIVLAMKRRRADERVEDLFVAELAEQLEELRRRIENWAAQTIDALTQWRRPARMHALDDRLQEAWDPLLAIADHACAGWPEKARAAANALASSNVDASEEPHGHTLLVALRKMFDADGDALTSKAICESLNENEELPFGGYAKGAGISPRGIAKLLRPYGIKPRSVRAGEGAGTNAKGYRRSQFEEVWQRYAPAATRPAHWQLALRLLLAWVCVRTGLSNQAAQAAHPAQVNNHAGFRSGTETSHAGTSGAPADDVPDSAALVTDVCRIANADEIRDVPDVPDVPAHSGAPRAHTSRIDYAALRGERVRMAADLTDDELLSMLPGATLEHAAANGRGAS
jgi:hypothetical protein